MDGHYHTITPEDAEIGRTWNGVSIEPKVLSPNCEVTQIIGEEIFMNGFLLLIPFLLIRFGVLSHLDRAAGKTRGFFCADGRKGNCGILDIPAFQCRNFYRSVFS
mgnify:CR=1 FL=1